MTIWRSRFFSQPASKPHKPQPTIQLMETSTIQTISHIKQTVRPHHCLSSFSSQHKNKSDYKSIGVIRSSFVCWTRSFVKWWAERKGIILIHLRLHLVMIHFINWKQSTSSPGRKGRMRGGISLRILINLLAVRVSQISQHVKTNTGLNVWFYLGAVTNLTDNPHKWPLSLSYQITGLESCLRWHQANWLLSSWRREIP